MVFLLHVLIKDGNDYERPIGGIVTKRDVVHGI